MKPANCYICDTQSKVMFIYCNNSHYICSPCYTNLHSKICPYCRDKFSKNSIDRFNNSKKQYIRIAKS